jgi:hypothetical protein
VTASWTVIASRSVRSVQAKTEDAPADARDGLNLDGVASVSFWLDAGEGETISADAGQFDVYAYDSGVWGLSPLLVLAVPPGAAGQRRVQLGTVLIDNPRGRLAPVANAIEASGATVILEALATGYGHGARFPA